MPPFRLFPHRLHGGRYGPLVKGAGAAGDRGISIPRTVPRQRNLAWPLGERWRGVTATERGAKKRTVSTAARRAGDFNPSAQTPERSGVHTLPNFLFYGVTRLRFVLSPPYGVRQTIFHNL